MTDLERIKVAIADHEAELLQKFQNERIINREQLDRTHGLISTDVAIIITGVRRCGKSMLAFMCGKQYKYAYINFEDERLIVNASELNNVLEAAYSLKGDVNLLIFDEIQNVPGWERFVARLLPSKRIIITGSNAHLLSRELATHLTGRHVDITLFPFSFREFLQWKDAGNKPQTTKEIAQVKCHLRDYIENGGFPLAYKLGKTILLETYKDILERDIIQRYHIRHTKVLRDLARYLISNIAHECSYNKIRNVMGVKGTHTITNYISYLNSAYLVFPIERFSYKLKEQMRAPKKIYAIDTGLARAAGFMFSENAGAATENVVAIELLRHSKEVYYWKDHQQREVDFVVKDGKKVQQLIQVCISTSTAPTREREIKSLIKASNELRCKNLLVITNDEEREERHGTLMVKYVSLWRWLLALD